MHGGGEDVPEPGRSSLGVWPGLQTWHGCRRNWDPKEEQRPVGGAYLSQASGVNTMTAMTSQVRVAAR